MARSSDKQLAERVLRTELRNYIRAQRHAAYLNGYVTEHLLADVQNELAEAIYQIQELLTT